MPNPHRERTEQKEFYDKPSHIEFLNDTERILRASLLAVKPEEGCALLIGKSIKLQHQSKPNIFQIQLIWPCCNVWGIKNHNHVCSNSLTEQPKNKGISRINRFELDPREQLFAQKWSRSKKLKILGTAHSHPINDPIPSKIDISQCVWKNLMVILNDCNNMKAWWIEHRNVIDPLELTFSSQIKKNGT